MDFFYNYLLFFAKCLTIIFATFAVLLFVLAQKKRTSTVPDSIEISDITKQYEDIKEKIQMSLLGDHELKQWKKDKKNEEKAKKKQYKKQDTDKYKPFLYVISFKGSADAHEVESLRKEITAILSVIKSEDDILIKLESPGGVVHGYGLAASQLARIKEQGFDFTVAVDKIAASGGYMMACVATKIVAAPFSIIGSIGVVAQMPNIHRLLKKNDVDIELHTAGEYKRTLTLLGENTEKGRQKFQRELEETHQLFKEFVQENRPIVDIQQVATGEFWFGSKAKEKGLVDEISTSDDLILSRINTHRIVLVTCYKKKKLLEKISLNITDNIEKSLLKLWQTLENRFF